MTPRHLAVLLWLPVLVTACGGDSADDDRDAGVAPRPDASVDASPAGDGGSGDAGDGGSGDAGSDSPPEILDLPAGVARLTFSEEFDGSGLDRSIWNRWYTSPAVINEELQFYALDNFELADGLLAIVAEREGSHGFDYTSGAITTFGSFSQAYGYFEMRARVPAGNGLWPAFWLLPADLGWPPEIDVMEHLGEDPSTVYLTYHWTDGGGAHQADGDRYTGPDYSAGFHTFAVDWRPGVLVWYVDGEERHRVEGPHVTATPAYLLANLAVGGTWPVPPDDTTPFPARYLIDYIRVYQYEPAPEGEAIPVQLGKTTVSTEEPAPGEAVEVVVRVDVAEPLPHGLVLQVILYDQSLSTELLGMHHTTASPLPAGRVEHRFETTIPSELTPGTYRLSVGVFREDWVNLVWLSNGVVLAVR